MTVRFVVEPRMVPPDKVARRLGVTPTVFAEKLPALLASGFPKPDAILGNYCLEAVDRWIDAEAGLTRLADPGSAQSDMMRAVRDRAWAK